MVGVVRKPRHSGLGWGFTSNEKVKEYIQRETAESTLQQLCEVPVPFLSPGGFSPAAFLPNHGGGSGDSLDPRTVSPTPSAIGFSKAEGELAMGSPHATGDLLSLNPTQPPD